MDFEVHNSFFKRRLVNYTITSIDVTMVIQVLSQFLKISPKWERVEWKRSGGGKKNRGIEDECINQKNGKNYDRREKQKSETWYGMIGYNRL